MHGTHGRKSLHSSKMCVNCTLLCSSSTYKREPLGGAAPTSSRLMLGHSDNIRLGYRFIGLGRSRELLECIATGKAQSFQRTGLLGSELNIWHSTSDPGTFAHGNC